jgi:hypothetical protein
MSTIAGARAGFTRGLIELRQAFSGAELIGQLFWPVATLVAIFLLRDVSIGDGYTLDTFIMPSTLGMFVALGMLLVVQQLAADREDGSLLRAKIARLELARRRIPLAADPRAHRDLGHLRTHHGDARLAGVDRPGIPRLLARPRHAFGAPARRRGRGRDRRIVAACGDRGGARSVGRRRAHSGPHRAPADGAERVGIARRRAPRAGSSAGRLSATCPIPHRFGQLSVSATSCGS